MQEAEHTVRKNLNHASTDRIENSVQYARSYITQKLPEWVLGKYIETLSSLVDIAEKYKITLTPEVIYLDNRGRLDPRRIVDAVEEVFPYGDKHGHSMNVNEFIVFVQTHLPQSVFERQRGRPMQSHEKDLSLKALDAVRTMRDIQNMFSNIMSASEKYRNIEAYVIWRLAQLCDDPREYHHYLINEENVRRFDSQETALPSDPEILATLLTALMDQAAASIQHPRHYMDYSCLSRLKSVIGNSMTKKDQIRKFVGGLINTQPVAPLGSTEQYIAHFEVVKGDESYAMPSGEDNLFYCVAVIFY